MKNIKTLSHWLNMKYTMPMFFIVAVFLLAGCGGGSSGTTNTGSTPTATTGSGSTAATPTTGTGASTPTITISSTCNIVTTAQASTILGGTVQTQSSSVTIVTTTANACAYKSSQGGTATLAVIAATDTTTAHNTFTQLQQATRATSGSKYQDVSGLGDGAFTNGTTLYVLKGKTLMVITVISSDSTKILPEEKQFAQDALPNVS